MQRWTAILALALLSSVSTRAHADGTEANVGERSGHILAEAGLGLVGGVAGFALGFVAASELAPAGSDGDCSDACGVGTLGWALVGGGVLGTVGASLGAYAAGEWMGGDGSLGWTALGSLSGAAMGAAAVILEARNDAPEALMAVTFLVPPLVGAVLGYELSSPSASDRIVRSASLDLLPARGGAAVGLRGTF
jgi:hypothetical protein